MDQGHSAEPVALGDSRFGQDFISGRITEPAAVFGWTRTGRTIMEGSNDLLTQRIGVVILSNFFGGVEPIVAMSPLVPCDFPSEPDKRGSPLRTSAEGSNGIIIELLSPGPFFGKKSKHEVGPSNGSLVGHNGMEVRRGLIR